MTSRFFSLSFRIMETIKIVEVGPRDGLQNETVIVPTEIKVAFVNALSSTGVSEVEVSAFVSPRWVPQLGDADDVFRPLITEIGPPRNLAWRLRAKAFGLLADLEAVASMDASCEIVDV